MSTTTTHFKPRGALRQWEERFGPNMTPMVDVVLVILIFFMAGSTFLGQEWFLKSELVSKGRPAAGQDPLQLPPTRLTFQVRRDAAGLLAISGMGDTPLDLAAFSARLRDFTAGTETKDIVVFIEPLPGVSYEDVIKVHEACLATGIERVGVRDQP